MNAIPNRRGLLLGALTAGAAASVAAISPITAADPPDPVFALLEAHKAAWARLLRIENQTDDYDTLEEAGRAVDVALNEITNPTDDCGRHARRYGVSGRVGRTYGLPADAAAIFDPAIAAAGDCVTPVTALGRGSY
jgi:hypothetical protein